MISFKDAPRVEPHLEVLPADNFSYMRIRMDESGRPPLKKWSPTQIYHQKAPITFEEARSIIQEKYNWTNPIAILTDIDSKSIEQAVNSIMKEPLDEDYRAWKQMLDEHNQNTLNHLENFD